MLIIDQSVKIYTKTNFLDFPDAKNLVGSWLQFSYVENQGMAFGTTLGSGTWAKLLLSTLRVVLIIGLLYYFITHVKQGVKMEFVFALSLIIAGAFGNLIDSMLYDYLFTFDPCMRYNELEGSGIKHDCGLMGAIEVRPHGFLRGNVVDMFQFNATWPNWVPYLGGGQVFPAIWNVADFSISVGVIYTLIRQKTIFPKHKKVTETREAIVDGAETEELGN